MKGKKDSNGYFPRREENEVKRRVAISEFHTKKLRNVRDILRIHSKHHHRN
jgi:hypothetical protein